MGHKVLVNGTSYEIKGGRALVDGTGYSITKGRTLIDGTGYDINFSNVSNILNSNDWATIREVSDAGTGANYWSIGDTKNIVINGNVGKTAFSNLSIDAFILGFNHNASQEGNYKIHFQIGKISGVPVALVDTQIAKKVSGTGYFSMNSSDSNKYGWKFSQIRTTVLGNSGTSTSPTANTLLAALPVDLRVIMKPVTKYSDNTGGGSDTASYVTSTTDYLFLLSELEYYGARTYANSAEQNYQAQYAYYQVGNDKIQYRYNATGAATYAWCRSVASNNNNVFCRVNLNGSVGGEIASYSRGIAPGFCV